MEIFSQIMIVLTGTLAIWLVSRKDNLKRWGYISGMVSQPFFFYTFYITEQWFLFAISFVYTYSWGKGIYNYWIKNNEIDGYETFR